MCEEAKVFVQMISTRVEMNRGRTLCRDSRGDDLHARGDEPLRYKNHRRRRNMISTRVEMNRDVAEASEALPHDLHARGDEPVDNRAALFNCS